MDNVIGSAVSLSAYQPKQVKFLTFSNQDGKRWSIPTKNTKTALALYEPSGIKGKLLKAALPLLAGSGMEKAALHGEYHSLVISDTLRALLDERFGEDWQISVYWGTPCVDQKITMQIYRGRQLLGYCKLGNSERTHDLFGHEKEILDALQTQGVSHIPRCLAMQPLEGDTWAYIQDTEKKANATIDHQFGRRQQQFLQQLFEATRQPLPFEDTEFAQSLAFLQQNTDKIDDALRASVEQALNCVLRYYGGRTVEWGVVHRDFTPWNTCITDGQLYVFDFEYALRSAPKELDGWHFYIQSCVFERGWDEQQIADAIAQMALSPAQFRHLLCYLLDIISFYIGRGAQEDIQTADSRARLLWNIAQTMNGETND